MGGEYRVIDTGVREGRLQIALDQALIELHRQGRVPDTVRFLRFPPTVLIGRHQALSHEVRVEACRAQGIGLVRRITGGGAIYLDEGQLGWELVLSRRHLPMPTLADYTRAICEAVAHGLSKTFGVDAHFRPRTDIEVAGRKLCGTGGFFDGDTLIYQGTVLIDADPARMTGLLNVPEARPAETERDKAATRLTTLKALLGRAPDVIAVREAVLLGLREKLKIATTAGEIGRAEETLAERLHRDEIGTDAFVEEIDDPGGADVLEARTHTPGGLLAAFVRLEGPAASRRVREVLLTGDFFALPPRTIYDLEAALRGVPVNGVAGAVDAFLAERKPEVLTLSASDISKTIAAAIRHDRTP